MTYTEIREICKRGEVGLIPRWLGYIKWDYGRNQLKFINGDYVLWEKDLKEKIIDRTDLYYII